ncbi:MAG: DUF1475 family protein [Bacteroidales bacterium]|nr:DUF1475 family protein [Bacteroidales bacterium]
MKTAKILAITGTLVMCCTLVWGFIYGDFWSEGSVLTSLVWGRVSLIDVYVGFSIVGAWAAFREVNFWRSIAWILGFFILGNFLACLYIWIQLERSGGSWTKFWFGNRTITN